jgi:hypothetical protein
LQIPSAVTRKDLKAISDTIEISNVSDTVSTSPSEDAEEKKRKRGDTKDWPKNPILKEKCRELGLKVGGNRDELIERLEDNNVTPSSFK